MSTSNNPPPGTTSATTSSIPATTTIVTAPRDPDDLLHQVQLKLKESDNNPQNFPMDPIGGGSSNQDKKPDSDVLDAFLPRIETRGQKSWKAQKSSADKGGSGQSGQGGQSGHGGQSK